MVSKLAEVVAVAAAGWVQRELTENDLHLRLDEREGGDLWTEGLRSADHATAPRRAAHAGTFANVFGNDVVLPSFLPSISPFI